MLNCKPGDLAIVVRSYAGNEGKILTCVRLASVSEQRALGYSVELEGPMWVTDRATVNTAGKTDFLMPDDRLRPLRGGSSEDEVLRLVGRPAHVGKPQAA